MIWLLTGPSCSGKSTLAFGPQRAAVAGAPVTAPVVFPASFDPSGLSIAADVVYHYNILRPVDAAWSQGIRQEVAGFFDFQSDLAWSRLCSLPHPKKAVILVASGRTLLSRMACRDAIEPAVGGAQPQYPREHWQAIARTIDLNFLYRSWCIELQANGIDFSLVDSSDFSYQPLTLADLQMRDLNRFEGSPAPS